MGGSRVLLVVIYRLRTFDWMSSTLNYQIGERVLCYHGPVIYEAKVLKAEIWDAANIKTGTAGPHYFVHYKGWKQTFVH